MVNIAYGTRTVRVPYAVGTVPKTGLCFFVEKSQQSVVGIFNKVVNILLTTGVRCGIMRNHKSLLFQDCKLIDGEERRSQWSQTT